MRSMNGFLSGIIFTSMIFLILGLSSNAQPAEPLLKVSCRDAIQDDEIRVLELADTDDDGVLNIIVGTSSNGHLKDYVYDQAVCKPEWIARVMHSTSGSIEDVDFADFDGDGDTDVLVNGFRARTMSMTRPKSNLTILDGEYYTKKWSDNRYCGQTVSVGSWDIERDGVPNVVAGSDTGRICVYENQRTKDAELAWDVKTPYRVTHLDIIDLEGDGNSELVALSSGNDSAVITVLNAYGKTRWAHTVEGGVYTAGGGDMIALIDVDNDAVKDFVFSTKRGFAAYSMRNDLSWDYALTDNNEVATMARTIVADPKNKRIFASARPYVYAFTHDGDFLWRVNVSTIIYSIALSDLNGDGNQEIVAAGDRLLSLISMDGRLLDSLYVPKVGGEWMSMFANNNATPYNLQINRVAAGDVDRDGIPEVIVTHTIVEPRILKETYKRGTLLVFEPNLGASWKNEEADTMVRQEATSTTSIPHQITSSTSLTEATSIIATTLTREFVQEQNLQGNRYLPFIIIILVLSTAIILVYTRKRGAGR